MMKLDAALTPADISRLPERDLRGTTCVVFDVLRATSSMITALANGASEIFPVKTIDEARALRGQMPDALLGGERHGERIEGFDLGNNPFDYIPVAGKRIISTTTNGTIALRACERAGRVLLGALLNLAALREELTRSRPAEVRRRLWRNVDFTACGGEQRILCEQLHDERPQPREGEDQRMQDECNEDGERELDAVGQYDESIKPPAERILAGLGWGQRLRIIAPSIAPITPKRET